MSTGIYLGHDTIGIGPVTLTLKFLWHPCVLGITGTISCSMRATYLQWGSDTLLIPLDSHPLQYGSHKR